MYTKIFFCIDDLVLKDQRSGPKGPDLAALLCSSPMKARQLATNEATTSNFFEVVARNWRQHVLIGSYTHVTFYVARLSLVAPSLEKSKLPTFIG